MNTQSNYITQVTARGLAPHEETCNLIRLAQDGCLKSRNEVVESNMRLVVKIASRYNANGMNTDDLINEGVIGMFTAIERYDESTGHRFSTYATFWIRQSISRAVTNKSRIVRWPVHFFQRKVSLYNLKSDIKEAGASLTDDEVAKTLNLSEAQVRALMSSESLEMSIDHQSGSDESGPSFLDSLECDEKGVDDTIIDKMQQDTIMTMVGNLLDERELFVIKGRFGLIDDDPLTLTETGRRLGLSRERVRQIESVALKKLRKFSADNEL